MNRELNKCFEVFDNYMIKRRVEVNEFTYGALLEACLKNKNLKKAREVYDRLTKDTKVKMNTIL
jgi:pentatricopeptide repeat protein